MKPVFTVPSMILATILATKILLPWYVGFFFVWGVVDFVARVYDAIQKTNMEFAKK